MVATEFPETGLVAMVKVVEALPSGMVTVAGTVAQSLLLEDRLTVIPPAGAFWSMVMVPVVLFPPTTDDGDMLS